MNTNYFRMVSSAPGTKLDWDKKDCNQLINYYSKPAAAAKLLQSCPTLRNPVDCSLPGSSIHGVFQARVLEWVAIAFSQFNGATSFKMDSKPA